MTSQYIWIFLGRWRSTVFSYFTQCYTCS